MADKKSNKTPEKSGVSYYFYGVLVGVLFVMLFNLVYFALIFRTSASTPIFTTFQLPYNNPKRLNIPILMYHYVEVVQDPGDTIRKSLSILPFTFEAQIRTLKDAGYTFLTPKDLNAILENKIPVPAKPIILSFDDGYRDFYTDVLPILKKYKVRSVQYIISGFLDQPNYLTRDQLREIESSKLVEVACHTMHHPALPYVSISEAQEEILGCHRNLLTEFGINTVSFAYPYGSYDPFLFPIVKTAGFKNAVTTKPGTNISSSNIYNIPRLRPGNRIGTDLTSYLESSIVESQKPQPFIQQANASE